MPNLNNSGIALPRFESADVTLFDAHAGSQLAETDKQSRETLSSMPGKRAKILMAHNLIASDRVEGTPVCRPTGEQIGVIQRLMIDKLSGQIAYAVLSFGGFLGFGQKHFPVPWRSLKYNPKHGAYEFEVTEEQLRAAPSFAPGEEFDWGDRSDEIQILVRHYPVHHGWE